MASGILVAVAVWTQRLALLQRAVHWAVGVEVELANTTWSMRTSSGDRSEVHVTLGRLLLFSPSSSSWASPPGRSRELLADVERVHVALHRRGGLRFSCNVTVEGLVLHFVAYDPLFADTNLKRLALAVGSDISAADVAASPGQARAAGGATHEGEVVGALLGVGRDCKHPTVVLLHQELERRSVVERQRVRVAA